MRSSAIARRFGVFSASLLTGAAVLVIHTAAFAQQDESSKDNAAKGEAAKDATPAKDASKDAKEPAAAPEAGANAPNPNELPPGYGPPPGYRNGPPPQGYPQPPQPQAEAPYYPGPYQHDYYYGPPPPPYGYGYPPPHYRRFPPPQPVRYYPEPLRYRPFFFGFGLGVSGVGEYLDSGSVYLNQGSKRRSRVGLGYDLRIGFGVSPRWSLVLAADGASAYFDNVSISETVFTIGPQVFLTPKLYLRAGVGAASRTYDYNDYNDYSYNDYYATQSDSGMGAVLAVGLEFMQSYHVALGVEANGTVGYYPNGDTLSTFGINFVMNLF